jgi:rRNA maturation endonuclease Nob1
MFEPALASVVYCVVAAAVFLGLWVYYDRRDQRRFDGERRKPTFHCIRCDALYAGGRGAEACRCPRCGYENVRLRF